MLGQSKGLWSTEGLLTVGLEEKQRHEGGAVMSGERNSGESAVRATDAANNGRKVREPKIRNTSNNWLKDRHRFPNENEAKKSQERRRPRQKINVRKTPKSKG